MGQYANGTEGQAPNKFKHKQNDAVGKFLRR